MRKFGLIGSLALTLAAVAAPHAVADTSVVHDAVVNVDDRVFDPPAVTIPVGGSVTWIERGINVHTASSLGGAPQQFSTGGFGPQESRSLTFNTPGTYPYTSATDCLNGVSMPGFICGVYYVLVVPPGGTAPQVATVATPGPAPTVQGFVPGGAGVVSITDGGMTPASVSVPVGGAVIWFNNGSVVHTATSEGPVPLAFDSGGLNPGQSAQVTFLLPGTYTYSSATECLNGNQAPQYQCGPYTVVVKS
jgi:plastocyanin